MGGGERKGKKQTGRHVTKIDQAYAKPTPSLRCCIRLMGQVC